MAASLKPSSTNVVPLPRMTRSGEMCAVPGDLAGLLAHDLKTPLAAISMNLDFLLEEIGTGASDAARGALEDCRVANARAVRIVGDMLDVARLASGERKASLVDIDTSALLGDLVRAVAPEATSRGVRMVWSSDEDVVRGDPDLLPRALERLLERAVRHARSGGAIEITVRSAMVTILINSVPGNENDASPPDAAMRALGMHFAEAALRAQGGAVWTESDRDGALVFRTALAAR
jgi:two-component system, OmpR family, sensor histidine kinase KdpD